MRPLIRHLIGSRFVVRPVAEVNAVKCLGRASRAELGETFNLVSWNISKARHADWLANITAVAHDTDFVLLQEAVLHGDRSHSFHETSGFEWIMAQSFAQRDQPVTSGLKTGSRVPSLARSMVRSLDLEPLYDSPKTLLATRYALPAQRNDLLVINIHAVNFVSTRKFSRQIDQLIKLLEHHAGPLIVAGDFNTWNVRRNRLLAKTMARFGLERVPVRPRNWRHLNLVLDHVFYRELVLNGARPMREIRGSDHVPLRVTFKL